jgi:hypothetical protein
MEGVPLFIVTAGLTAGLAAMLVSADLEQIKQNWSTRRCDLPVMIMGTLFKPESFKGTASEFSSENMNFCVRQIAKGVMITLLAPVTALLGNQSSILGVLDTSLNMMRTLLSNAMSSFGKLIDPFYRRFMLIGGNFRIIFQQFLSAMNRVFAISISQLLMGISAFVGMQNMVSFIIKVVMIIMGIIIAIFILLFFVLIPFLPMILTVIGILASVGLAVGGTEVFCFAPQTEVLLINGLTKPIAQIQVGDKLAHGATVEGILLTTRNSNIPMYNYKGIFVSGSHIVWENKQWTPVASSEKGLQVSYDGERLYSLRTTSREIFAKNLNGDIILFKDWEEIPEGDERTDSEWDILVQHLLGNTTINTTPSTTDPLFSPATFVIKDMRLVPLHTIQIGDLIGLNSKGDPTRVMGIYRGNVLMNPFYIKEKWHTDGVWWKHDENWLRTPEPTPLIKVDKVLVHGLHLITESGTFWVHSGTHSGTVRDFTEVGSDKLMEATEILLKILSEKPMP